MRNVVVFAAFSLVLAAAPAVVSGHPGGTDEQGCHTCHTHCEKWDVEAEAEHCHGDDASGGEDEDGTDDKEPAEREEHQDESLEEGQRAYVDKVVDGDTLEVRILDGTGRRVKVRILGIDCPESHKNPKCRRQGRQGGPGCEEQIPRGLKAAKYAAKLVKHRVVGLESGQEDGEFEKGGYGRVLAYIRLKDGRDLGEVLIQKGLCRNYGDKYPHARDKAYDRAEQGDED